MTEEYYVEPCKFTCAKDFLDALEEISERCRGETWLYRGQNVDKPLLPSAMRPCKIIDDYAGNNPDSFLRTIERDGDDLPFIQKAFHESTSALNDDRKFVKLIRNLRKDTEHLRDWNQTESRLEEFPFNLFQAYYLWSTGHSLAERKLLYNFESLADQVGLAIPPDRFATNWNKPLLFKDRVSESDRLGADYTLLRTEDCYGVAYAFARHHRIPARLLDVTYRPLVAVFFAAHCEDKCDDGDNRRIVVWAINQNRLSGTGLKVIKHRRVDIGFLRAQEGAFLLDELTNEKFWFAGEWIPFEYYLKGMVAKKEAYKLSLPFNERKELLKLLREKGVNKAVLMPSYDNVANEVQRDETVLLRSEDEYE
ncbi:MAG: FRG domain-containing protein [Chloroflexota bacterium]|nr:FRG domain-containing protein [Chloroflexota bacterium]